MILTILQLPNITYALITHLNINIDNIGGKFKPSLKKTQNRPLISTVKLRISL